MDQPRVPAGNPRGGQWTSRNTVSSRGDYFALTGDPNLTVKLHTPHKQKEARTEQAKASVDRARNLLRSKGINADHLKVELTDRIPREYPADTIGLSDIYENSITLNVGTRYFDRLYENQKAMYDSGLHSSAHKDHAIIHEMGHQLHREALKRDWRPVPNQQQRKELKTWARKVSRYAAHPNDWGVIDEHEFVAEVFAGAIGGQKYPIEIQVLYSELGGPNVDQIFGG